MQQKIYRGNFAPSELADFLVQHFDPQPDIQAQKIGKDDAYIVQVGQGDVVEKIRNAISLSIARSSDDASQVVVSMGEQHWITPTMAGGAAFWGLIAALVTPWALFMLLWPLSEAMSGRTLPGDIWNQVEIGVASLGGSLAELRTVTHPHEGQGAEV